MFYIKMITKIFKFLNKLITSEDVSDPKVIFEKLSRFLDKRAFIILSDSALLSNYISFNYFKSL